MVLEFTPRPKRRGMRWSLARITVIVVVLAGLGAQSGSAAEDPEHSGLPYFGLQGAWIGPEATGITQAQRPKQWVRLPPMILGAWNRLVTGGTDNSCDRYFPFKSVTNFHATAFFRSDAGAVEPWGYSSPFTARTVAFGSIPVEATIQLRQPRDEENLPIGIEIKQETGIYCDKEKPYPDIVLPRDLGNARNAPADIKGQVEVAVLAVNVDGVDLDLTDRCRTSRPGDLSLTSREHFTMSPDNLTPGVPPYPENLLTTPYLSLATGGLIFGTADIAPFAGCVTTGGEDVSKLLTATISGPDNPVTMRTNGLFLGCFDTLYVGKC